MITLRGVTWDHPRAVDSIRSASDAFHAANPNVVVEWVARPLHEFEDVPIEELAGSFDLLALDHPFMGDAAEHGALMPLNDLVPAPELGVRAEAYVGQSYESYTWNGLQLALPVDAACMVSAFRPDRIDHTTLPKQWSDAADFIRNLDSGRTLMAANPTHLWCTFLTLCEAVSGASSTTSSTGPVWWTEGGIDEAVFAPAIDLLRGLLAVSSPLSLHSDPIAVLNLLASDGDFDYCPLVFEYSTYSLERDGLGLIEFANGPSGDDPTSGPLTGGVGLAVSALSAEPLWAAESALLIPPLTTVRQDFPTLGQRAFHHLKALLAGPLEPGQLTVTRPELIVRASTAPPGNGQPDRIREALKTLNEAWLRQ